MLPGKEIIWTLIFCWHLVTGVFRPKIAINSESKVTEIIPAYSQERLGYVKRQIEMLKKCNFFEVIIILNHNPNIKLEQQISAPGDRLTFIDHKKRHSCGCQ
jgi:hypothetical protein